MPGKYQVGDEVWIVTKDETYKALTCPACCGSLVLTVLSKGERPVTVACPMCSRGGHSLGSIRESTFRYSIRNVTIDSKCVVTYGTNPSEVSYTAGRFSFADDEAFADEWDAYCRFRSNTIEGNAVQNKSLEEGVVRAAEDAAKCAARYWEERRRLLAELTRLDIAFLR